MSKNMFEVCSRKKLRFETQQGVVSVEALWDLPLESKSKASLNSVAILINRQLKETQEESFVTKPSLGNSELALKLDVVKHIIDVKLEESRRRLELADNKAKKEQLMELIQSKKNDQLLNKPLEELEAELANLG